MNKELFTKVSDRIETAVSAIRWIDFDDGILDMQTERPGMAFPACLIDINYPDTEDETGTEQLVNATITLRLAFKPAGVTNNLFGSTQYCPGHFRYYIGPAYSFAGMAGCQHFLRVSRAPAIAKSEETG